MTVASVRSRRAAPPAPPRHMAFEPEALIIIGHAYDMALRQLGPIRLELREQMAKAILDSASQGIRHPWSLCEAALDAVSIHV